MKSASRKVGKDAKVNHKSVREVFANFSASQLISISKLILSIAEEKMASTPPILRTPPWIKVRNKR